MRRFLFFPLIFVLLTGLTTPLPAWATSPSAGIAPAPAKRKPVASKQSHRSTQPSAAIVRAKKNKAKQRTSSRNQPPAQNISAPSLAEQISARSALVINARDGSTVFAKMADNLRQPASTIKIVTAMIALESLPLDEEVEASWNAVSMEGSKMYLQPGQRYRVDDLINGVLLSSANDAAVALAERIGGTEDKFAHLMSLTTKMWGAKNTLCKTASGLTAVGQQTTARDLATLMRYAMQQESFASRMRQKYISTSYGQRLRNHNRALWRILGAEGGKTGYTVVARQTYVGQFSRDGRTIIVAIMGSETMWADLKKLVNYGFDQGTAALP